MSEVVYNEDLVKRVKNKYLAVNVTAKRARDINAEGLLLDEEDTARAERKRKPVAIATQELVEGKLRYEQSEEKHVEPNTYSLFSHPVEDEDEPIFDEEIVPPAEETYEEQEETEEGL